MLVEIQKSSLLVGNIVLIAVTHWIKEDISKTWLCLNQYLKIQNTNILQRLSNISL